MPVDRYKFGGRFFSLTYEFSKLERNLCGTAGLYVGQPRILTILKDNEGCTLSELSELCGIGMPSLSVSVRNMVKSGLIRKGNAEKDSRAQLLYLTDVGHTKAEIFHESIDAFYKNLLDALGDSGAEEADNLIHQLTKHVAKINKNNSTDS
jgi:DNA-binding MarR family transcriptional regulator